MEYGHLRCISTESLLQLISRCHPLRYKCGKVVWCHGGHNGKFGNFSLPMAATQGGKLGWPLAAVAWLGEVGHFPAMNERGRGLGKRIQSIQLI
jgi:hypothetical protein